MWWLSIRREKISADNVYNYLILFHDAYDQLPDIMEEKVLPELHSGDSVIPGTAGKWAGSEVNEV